MPRKLIGGKYVQVDDVLENKPKMIEKLREEGVKVNARWKLETVKKKFLEIFTGK